MLFCHLFKFLKCIYSLREDLISKSTFSFGHCPKRGGGFTHARIFWSFFTKLKSLKTNDMCMFFVIIIIKITIITIIIIITTIIIINGTFFSVIRAKRRFDVRKKVTKLPEMEGGGGGGLPNLGNARKKTCFSL